MSPVKPTLKTIAEISGLAVPTVSRALNDAPDIGARTKILVRKIADELGYVPNRAGVRLRTGRTNVISLVLSTEHDMMNHTARLISAIAGEMQGTSFHMNITPYFPSDDPMKPIRYIVETRSADAVIMNQILPEDPRVAYLRERNFPFVTHGRTRWADSHPYFDFDNTAFGRIGVEKLVMRGRRNIVMISPPRNQNYAQNMIDGGTGAARAAGCSMRVMQGTTSDNRNEDIQLGVARHLAEFPETDGIVCSATAVAMAAVATLESLQHRLGEDVDVIAKEAVPFLTLFRPQMLTVHEDVARAGQFLAQAAIQAVRHPEKPPLQGLDVPTG
ncbi:HTH-type transcriptional regulator RafR [Roseisalinus antarcticus]|uniref:HTH-type transcriptional regulator RafR n=2 Tax=Roseisalinus antarcticus TaxID=254357 RepID=A0A1Y5T978_9RHOB|nr:HTH-type transcriptional regulator RafR [Roseisalinus antarcticus]